MSMTPPPAYPAPTNDQSAPGVPGPGPKLSVSWTGLLLALGAVVAAIGSFLPFEKLVVAGSSYKFTGLGSESGDSRLQAAFEPGNAGKVILVVAVIALVLGLLVAARKGRLWVSIVAVVASAIGLVMGLAALAAPSSDAKDLGGGVTGSVQIGSVLATVGTAIALLAAILALCMRRVSASPSSAPVGAFQQ